MTAVRVVNACTDFVPIDFKIYRELDENDSFLENMLICYSLT
jgi:hypothetical protein